MTGLAKEMFNLPRKEATTKAVIWLGVWEKNFKAQNFYFKYEMNVLVKDE